ncbi:phosphoesterase family-domain-containing protein [Xylariales sp. PMI_506]|nr:phosphoesterase family-domain-containing protein [Xylariales sp. PMI_506]
MLLLCQFLICALLGRVVLAQGASTIVPGRGFDRFISIWLENQDFVKVAADPDIVDLKRYGILHTNYYAHTHPSQPNYLASVAGDYFGLNHDDFVRVPRNVSTVVDLLEDKGVSWGGYFEGNPGPGYMGVGSIAADGTWDYVRKHNHFVSFDSINRNGLRLAKLLSFKDFERSFAAGTLPQFIMMSPDMNNDGHNTTLSYATKWAHEFLLPLLADDAFAESTVIQLTYDESEDYGKPNRIVSLLLGNGIPKALQGTEDNTFYTHYSVLATAENNWDLANLGRYDVGANVFSFVADATGYTNKEPSNAASVDNSVSYPGALNNESAQQRGIPPPNLKLTGASGQPILKSIKTQWTADQYMETPYDGSGNVFDGDKNLPIYALPQPNAS